MLNLFKMSIIYLLVCIIASGKFIVGNYIEFQSASFSAYVHIVQPIAFYI